MGASSYHGPATLIHEDGETAIECAFHVTVERRSGLNQWSGSFYDAGAMDEPESVLGDARLRLPNGAEGTVIVNHLAEGSGTFLGTGDPPEIPP